MNNYSIEMPFGQKWVLTLGQASAMSNNSWEALMPSRKNLRSHGLGLW